MLTTCTPHAAGLRRTASQIYTRGDRSDFEAALAGLSTAGGAQLACQVCTIYHGVGREERRTVWTGKESIEGWARELRKRSKGLEGWGNGLLVRTDHQAAGQTRANARRGAAGLLRIGGLRPAQVSESRVVVGE